MSEQRKTGHSRLFGRGGKIVREQAMTTEREEWPGDWPKRAIQIIEDLQEERDALTARAESAERALEIAQGLADRRQAALDDALAAMSRFIPTPVGGYRESPQWVASDIRMLGCDRNAAQTEARRLREARDKVRAYVTGISERARSLGHQGIVEICTDILTTLTPQEPTR